jgi:hypothetical protein
MLLLARIVRLIGALAVGFVVVGIALHLLDANSGNAIVSFVYDVAGKLASPFANVFGLHGKAHIAVNWGLAAVVYAIATAAISRLLTRAGLGIRGGFTRRRRVAA